jgi:hypothetical protein
VLSNRRSHNRAGVTASAIIRTICGTVTPIAKGTPCLTAVARIEWPVMARSGYVSVLSAAPVPEAVSALVVDAAITVVAEEMVVHILYDG